MPSFQTACADGKEWCMPEIMSVTPAIMIRDNKSTRSTASLPTSAKDDQLSMDMRETL